MKNLHKSWVVVIVIYICLFSLGEAQTCDGSNCESCLNSTACLQCKTNVLGSDNYPHFLDFSALTCIDTCLDGSFPISLATGAYQDGVELMYSYCREPRFFVDPSSLEDLELGTSMYPFKSMIWPVKELFNTLIGIDKEISLFIRKDTENMVWSSTEPLVFAKTLNVTFRPYDIAAGVLNTDYLDSSLRTTLAFNFSTIVYREDTAYNPIKLYSPSYDTAPYLERQLLKLADLQISQALKIFGIQTSLHFLNINFIEYVPTTEFYNQLFSLSESFGEKISFMNCHLKFYNTIMLATKGYVVEMYNSLVDLSQCANGLLMEVRCQDASHREKNKMYVVNTEFYGYSSFNPVLLFQGYGYEDFLVANSTFTDISPETINNFLINNDECGPFEKNSFLFVNNTLQFVYDKESYFSQSFQLGLSITYNGVLEEQYVIDMSGNTINNLPMIQPFLTLDAVMDNLKISVENNQFEKLYVKSSLIQGLIDIETSNNDVMIANNTFLDSTIDSIFSISKVTNLVILHNKAIGLKSSNLASSNSLVRVLDVQSALLEDFILSDSAFDSNTNVGAMSFTSIKNLILSHFSLANISTTTGNIIQISSVETGRILDLNASDVHQFPGMPMHSFFTFQTLDTLNNAWLEMSLERVRLENSSIPLLSAIQMQSESQFSEKPAEIRFSDLRAQNVSLSSFAFIDLNAIIYQNFWVVFENTTFHDFSLSSYLLRSIMNGNVLFRNCSFTEIEGQIVLAYPNQAELTQIPNTILIDDSYFARSLSHHDGMLVARTNSFINVSNSTFMENLSPGRGSVAFADQKKSVITFHNCTLENNYGQQGGVAFAHQDSQVDFDACELRGNFALQGGVAYVNDEGFVTIRSSSLENNFAFEGLSLYQINSREKSLIRDSNFTNYRSIDQSILDDILTGADLSFITMVYEAEGYQKLLSGDGSVDAVASLQKSFLGIEGTLTLDQTTSFVLLSADSILSIFEADIKNFQIQSFIDASRSQVLIEGTVVDGLTQFSENENSIIKIQANSLLNLTDSNFTNLASQLFDVQLSQLLSERVRISGIELLEGSFVYLLLSEAILEEWELVDFASRSTQPLIKLVNSHLEAYRLNSSSFENVFMNAELSTVFINDSAITHGIATESTVLGGVAIHSHYSHLTLTNSTFSYLDATSGMGAAIKFEIEQTHTYQLLISNCTFSHCSAMKGGAVQMSGGELKVSGESMFIDNYAKISGGALQLDHQIGMTESFSNFVIEETTFKRNIAQVKGGAIQYNYKRPEIASNVIFEDNSASYGSNQGSVIYQVRPTTDQELEVQSGINIEAGSLQLQLLDQDGRVVNIDSETSSTLFAEDQLVVITGMTTFTYEEGIFAPEFQITAKPGSSVDLVLSTANLDQFGIPQLDMTFHIQPCQLGWVEKNNMCVYCVQGTYSFILNATTCESCPKDATCQGGSSIALDEGFWRPALNSTNIYLCLNSKACLGGENSTCLKGHHGMLCQRCIGWDEESPDDYYARSGLQQCVLCGSLVIEGLKVFGLLTFFVLYVIVLTMMIVRNPKRQKDHSVLLRIVTNYFQELLMIKDLNLSWPASITTFFAKFTFVTNSGSALIKINCFFQSYGDNTLSTFVIGMIFFSLTPFFFALFSFIPFGLKRLIWPHKYKETYIRNFIAFNLTFIFLIYPTITSYAFGMFNCTEVEGVNYLSADFSIECWSTEHIYLQLKYTLPAILVWVLGFPIFLFYVLFRNRHDLSTPGTIVKYGLYYIGFKDESFYWQILIVNMRRALYIAIAVSVQSYNKNMFVYFIFFIMYSYMSITRYIQPYHLYYLNQTEIYSSLATMTTLLFSLFYIQDKQLISDTVLEVIFVLMIFINASYLFYWVIKIIPIGLKMTINFFRKCCPEKCDQMDKKLSKYYVEESGFGQSERNKSEKYKTGEESKTHSFHKKISVNNPILDNQFEIQENRDNQYFWNRVQEENSVRINNSRLSGREMNSIRPFSINESNADIQEESRQRASKKLQNVGKKIIQRRKQTQQSGSIHDTYKALKSIKDLK